MTVALHPRRTGDYWGLRNYGVEPQVWDGRAGCVHEWGEWRAVSDVREETSSGKTRTTDRFFGDESRRFNGNHQKHTAGAFCQLCGAWRGSFGLEPTPELYIQHAVSIFREVRRVIKGTLWLNIGDSYATGAGSARVAGGDCFGKANKIVETGDFPACQPNRMPQIGLKPKDLVGIPWMLAFALRADGWWLRQEIIWHKPNPMPESVQGSHYSRHTVTIEEYERLSGLRYVDECAGDAWAGNMPNLSEREISSSKAPLSANGQGYSYGKGQRGARRRAGEAEAVQPLKVRETQQGEVRGDQQGEGGSKKKECEVSFECPRKEGGGGQASTDERQTEAPDSKKNREFQVQENREREGAQAARVRDAEGGYPCNGHAIDSGGVAGNCDRTQGSLPLLPHGKETHFGSRDSAEQGRTSHEGERSAGVRSVQLQETGQTELLVGCPGCPKCIKHHGFIFHLSAGRPTRAHEQIFLLAKSERYFYDADAIKERGSADSHARYARGRSDTHKWADGGPGNQTIAKSFEHMRDRVPAGWHQGTRATGSAPRDQRAPGVNPKAAQNQNGSKQNASFSAAVIDVVESRNKRSVWTVATQPTPEAHFATYPIALIEPCILAGCPEGGVVLDPFSGAGTTGMAALKHGRAFVGIELSQAYVDLTYERIAGKIPLLVQGA